MNAIWIFLTRSSLRLGASLALPFLLLTLVLGLAGCKAGEAGDHERVEARHSETEDDDDDDDDDGERHVDAAMLDRGHHVYEQNCAPCHGATGKGDGTAAASLDPKPRDHTNRAYMDTLSDASIAEVVKVGGALRGFPNMPSHPHLVGDDMVALVAFVRSLSRGADAVREVELDVD